MSIEKEIEAVEGEIALLIAELLSRAPPSNIHLVVAQLGVFMVGATADVMSCFGFGSDEIRELVSGAVDRMILPYVTCNCCSTSYTRPEWLELELVGVQEDDEGRELQLRNCPCKSTMTVQLRGPVL